MRIWCRVESREGDLRKNDKLWDWGEASRVVVCVAAGVAVTLLLAWLANNTYPN
ncbi:MAG: hypothetical protein V3S68_02420 [Dehalococcoidia bacterium]